MKRAVLFVCIGNSCRSPMAEGFARKYGSDVIEPYSAGLAPAQIIQPLTKKVMAAKNINIDDQYPKEVGAVQIPNLELIVNMSGAPLTLEQPIEVRDWIVPDPIGQTEEVYIQVRDQIETLVMRLILEFRRKARDAASTPGTRRRFLRSARPPVS